MSKMVIVFAQLDKFQLTMYEADGTKHEWKQGDPRIAKVITPENVRILGVEGQLEVDFTEESVVNHFSEFEKKTNGVVKFFRIAKAKLKSIFENLDAVEGTFGSKPIPQNVQLDPTAESQDEVLETQVAAVDASSKLQNAVAEIMEQASSTEDKGFHQTAAEAAQDTETTVVAVVDGQNILPDAENLTNLVAHAVKNPETSKGLEAFMKRMGAVAATRRHSAEDLMKFLKTADLPFSDEGDIIAYKNLNAAREDGYFTDIHSGNVKQKLGSLVFMEESMVDPNRRNDCSNGLHIASRSYLGGFRGGATVVCRIRPEDVIAVPEYNHNKMRVCAYHIIDVLPADMARTINNNKPITDAAGGAERLAKYIAGQHIGILEHTEIGGSRGSNLKITKLVEGKEAKQAVKEVEAVVPSSAATVVEEVTNETSLAPEVDVRAIQQVVKQVKAESHREVIARLFKDGLTKETALQIQEIKKKSKKSWTVLGVSDMQVRQLSKF